MRAYTLAFDRAVAEDHDHSSYQWALRPYHRKHMQALTIIRRLRICLQPACLKKVIIAIKAVSQPIAGRD
jgi:hypothetical protein